ncbi:hypothetical protein VB773_06825 [Haloarculaceae archaeon H-GB2-1]|nr:hypothetical protein [Haloarculaceae archaeon H-GB1-1]MEA5385807.1 hypothetical protein [Haloarculaceae archaeon H-GB11]MEA5407307.1 hypothetical protein [Haloarculaceae archaeon H-GB2-1]
MARGQKDGSKSDEGRILSPDELDITDDEHVAELDDGRFVVSPSGPIDATVTTSDDSDADETEPESTEATESSDQPVELDDQVVHDWLSDRFDATNSRYGFDVTAKFDDSVRQRHMVSNDVVTIFESLILWYAQQIDSGTPVEEILGILLMESNVPIHYPPTSLETMLKAAGLTPDDSIADLIEAVSEDEGLRL